MSRVHYINLQCEIDPRSESIHGEMSIRQGESLSFSGWTEFAGALVSLTSVVTEETGSGLQDLEQDAGENKSIEAEEK